MSDIRFRSLLFAPGDDLRKLERALSSGADAVVADLEDAVAPNAREEARSIVRGVFAARPTASARVVRVNGARTDDFAHDLELVGELALDAIVLPKADPESMALLPVDLPAVIAIVETAVGLRLAYETACASQVAALLLGSVDLGAELRLESRADGLELLYARARIVESAAVAGIAPPIDGVHVDVRDRAGLERAARFARSLGFRGKACVHPEQVPVVNDVFTFDPDEVERARAILQTYEEALLEGRGVAVHAGQMIDAAVVQRARRTLREAEVLGGRS